MFLHFYTLGIKRERMKEIRVIVQTWLVNDCFGKRQLHSTFSKPPYITCVPSPWAGMGYLQQLKTFMMTCYISFCTIAIVWSTPHAMSTTWPGSDTCKVKKKRKLHFRLTIQICINFIVFCTYLHMAYKSTKTCEILPQHTICILMPHSAKLIKFHNRCGIQQ